MLVSDELSQNNKNTTSKTMAQNTFKSKKILIINDQKYIYYDLNELTRTFGLNLNSIPFTYKILLEKFYYLWIFKR